ncbi:MAG: GFA family protein [Variovorax sp.]|nr:MAG: GFA family protein [Variovorax sp.]
MKFQGSCHCGRIRFEAEGELGSATSCNCSICRRKGTLMWFVPRDAFTLLTPESDTSTYLFNRHVVQHRFCSTCGIHPYGEGKTPTGEAVAAVNIRCLDGVDLETIPVQVFDGRALPA